MKKIFFTFSFLTLCLATFAQDKEFTGFEKGQLYGSWGWNRAFFTTSNIHFKGNDYSFTLYHVKAHDRPTTPIGFKNYVVRPFTPQNNYKMGYFIKNNLAISFGVDHMKYVMDQNQTVTMKGNISRSGIYQGDHNGPQELTRDFLTFEHTNGLNYINAEVEKYKTWYHSKSNKLVLSGMLGIGTGILYPKSDIKLLDYKENDQFHVAGFGLSAKAAISARFFKYLMVHIESKNGYIDLPSIILHEPGIPGRAHQHFFFTELVGNVGLVVPIAKNKKEMVRTKRVVKVAD